jgi:acetyltransferase-like isoleucine patch superfamily enzyme
MWSDNLFGRLWQWVRIRCFRAVSNIRQVSGTPQVNQPLQMMGQGHISFGNDVQIGFFPSPFYHDGSVYLEAREHGATIRFGHRIMANNNLKVVCERTSVDIGDDVLMGTSVEIIDSDFHEMDPQRRNAGNHRTAPVRIGNNVFLGSNVRIMKGVTIGDNSVVGNGAVVIDDIPADCIALGNPAKVIRHLRT